MVEVYAVAITYLEIVEQADAVYHRPVASNEMHRPVGTVADGNVADSEIFHVCERKYMRTWVEGRNRLKLVGVVKFLSHECNAVAVNGSLACYGDIVCSIGIYPHHTLATVLPERTQLVDALVGIGQQHCSSLKVQVDIGFQAQRPRHKGMVGRQQYRAATIGRALVNGLLYGLGVICNLIAHRTIVNNIIYALRIRRQ